MGEEHSPSVRSGLAMAYDAARGRTVLHGFGQGLPETWEWDGNNWLKRVPAKSPSGRNSPAFAYDSARSKIVFFGGQDASDTWEYGPVHPASYTTFGTGCAGSAGTPSLSTMGGARPWLGDTITVQITSVPSSTAAVLFVGSSRSAWGRSDSRWTWARWG